MRALLSFVLALALALPAHAGTLRKVVLSGGPCLGVVLSADFTGGQSCNNGSPKPFTAIPGYSFTRASQETCTDASGLITYAANNVPCVNSAGYAAWQAATNLNIWSQAFDNVAYIKTDVTITPDVTVAPDGTGTSDLVTEGVAGTALLQGASATVTPSTAITGCVYAKRSAVIQWLRLKVGGANGVNGWFDMLNGAAGTPAIFGSATSPSETIQSSSAGFYRLCATATLTASDTAASVQYASASANGNTAKVNNSAYYLWQADLTQAGFAQPAIPTTTASATRAADVMSFPWVPAAQGTVVASWVQPVSAAVSNNRLVGSGTNVVPIQLASGAQPVKSFDGANILNGPTTTIADLSTAKGAFNWTAATRSLSVNGAAPTSDAHGIGTISSLYPGSQAGTSNWLNSTIRSFAIYSTAKNTQALTK